MSTAALAAYPARLWMAQHPDREPRLLLAGTLGEATMGAAALGFPSDERFRISFLDDRLLAGVVVAIESGVRAFDAAAEPPSDEDFAALQAGISGIWTAYFELAGISGIWTAYFELAKRSK